MEILSIYMTRLPLYAIIVDLVLNEAKLKDSHEVQKLSVRVVEAIVLYFK